MPPIQTHDFEFRISNFEFPIRLPLERSERRGKSTFIGGAWHPDMTLSSTSCRRAWHPLVEARGETAVASSQEACGGTH